MNPQPICTAIRDKRVVQFWYDDGVAGFRKVAPYTIGYNKAGNLALSGYFIAGVSKSGMAPMWREYLVERITQFSVLDEVITAAAPGYVPGGGKLFLNVLADFANG